MIDPDYKSSLLTLQQSTEALRRRRIRNRLIVLSLVFICVSGIAIYFFWHLSKTRAAPEIVTQPAIVMPTELDSNFITVVNECFMPITALYGYTLRISSGFRSLNEQDLEYQQGRTINGHIITEAPAGKSIHNYGFAVDVVDRWKGYDIDWIKLGKIGAYCGLEQGPDGDYPHFEHRGGLTTADFAAGLKPSMLILPCPILDILAKANKPLTLNGLKACAAPEF